jgi:hypothetical protein
MSIVTDSLSLSARHRLYRVRTRVISAGLVLVRRVLLVGGAIAVGWISAWYMVEAGSRLTTQRVGPWVSWTAAGRPGADPYTRAHFARLGGLQINGDIARNWMARTDQTGERLHSACDYALSGRLPTTWWSLSVFDEKGRLIRNAADRYSYSSQTIALQPNGSFIVALGRDARPGNWLPTGGAGRLTLQLTMLDQRGALIDLDANGGFVLPAIRKVSCR